MLKSKRNLLLASLAVGVLAVGGAACQSGGGDVNAYDINVTVNIPKTLVTSASGIGVVYVGVYSGIDNSKGYPSPVTAPAASSVGDDAFPFGGSSIGDFQSRDIRSVCQAVSDQTVVDAGDHWQVSAQILQFPWIKGQVVWAFSDRYNAAYLNVSQKSAFPTCDPDHGFFDNAGFPIQITDIVQSNAVGSPVPTWKVHFAPTPVDYFSVNNPTDPLQILDGHGQFYQALIKPNNHPALDGSSYTIVVSTPPGTSLVPKATGPTPTRLESFDAFLPYGTQFEDILNFPSKYILPGSKDLVVSTPAVLNTPSNVTITLDTPVP